MATITSVAVSGLNDAISRATTAAQNIATASTAGGGGSDAIDSNLIDLQQASISYAADAKVISTANKLQKTLIDTIA